LAPGPISRTRRQMTTRRSMPLMISSIAPSVATVPSRVVGGSSWGWVPRILVMDEPNRNECSEAMANELSHRFGVLGLQPVPLRPVADSARLGCGASLCGNRGDRECEKMSFWRSSHARNR
jgi:hypothetical protein